jgi:predicted alpha/beta superfamily hydrolase
MKRLRLRNLFLTVLLFISSSSLFGQKLQPKEKILEPDTTISSKIMGKDYQLYISFPSNYSTKDTVKYPVLYLLDGRVFFPIIKSAREPMDFGGELEQVIIVGIGSGLDGASWYVNRTYDYTTSKDTVFDRKDEKKLGFPKGTLQSGGAEKFLQCITKEIIPYVETHYKTNRDRGITGHSLGGLFSAYCLLHSKGVFTRYGISSPSLWWNNNEMGNQADSLFSKNETWDIPPVKIFMSVGQKEGPLMVPTMTKFSTQLEEKAYKNVTLTWHVFEDETHLSVIPASLSRTLTVLYGTKK